MHPSRPRLGQLLVDARIIAPEQLSAMLALQKSDGRRLGTLMVEAGLLNETQLTQILSQQLNAPWVSLYHIDFSRQLLNLVPRDVAEKYCLVPIYVRHVRGQGDTLYVAMDDPTNEEALRACSASSNLPARAMIAPPSDIRSAIGVYYGARGGARREAAARPEPGVPPPTERVEVPRTEAAQPPREAGGQQARAAVPGGITAPPSSAPLVVVEGGGLSELGDGDEVQDEAGDAGFEPGPPIGFQHVQAAPPTARAAGAPPSPTAASQPRTAIPAPASLGAPPPRPSAPAPQVAAPAPPRPSAPQTDAALSPGSAPPLSSPLATSAGSAASGASGPTEQGRGVDAVRASVPRPPPPAPMNNAAALLAAVEGSTPPPAGVEDGGDNPAEIPEMLPEVTRLEHRRPARRSARPGAKMINLTLLDGTTIALPAKGGRAARLEAHSPGSAQASSEEGAPSSDETQLTARDLVAALRAVTHGADASDILGNNARWEALFSALLSLLLKKHLIADWEFIEEFKKI
jgi:hypothetical protein